MLQGPQHSFKKDKGVTWAGVQMYADARASASSHQELQQHITAAMGDKAEWESKVHVLQQELAALANATPELLEQLRYETEQLRGAAAAAEAEKRAFEDQTAGLRASKAQLTERLDEVKAALDSSRVRTPRCRQCRLLATSRGRVVTGGC